MLPDNHPPAAQDKRKSTRWEIDRPLQWRLRGGRRVRECRLCERSLHGMVLKLEGALRLRVGQMILPADPETGVRNGFRLGIIRRIENPEQQPKRICVEILS